MSVKKYKDLKFINLNMSFEFKAGNSEFGFLILKGQRILHTYISIALNHYRNYWNNFRSGFKKFE